MRKRLLSLALALALCFGLTVPAMAALNPGEEWVGDFVVNGDTLVRYYGDGGAVTIPDGITTIGVGAFVGCTGLISVTIPNSVTTIKHNAFDGCTGLTSVTIPDSVTTMEYNAFGACTALTSVTLPNGITTLEDGVFFGCKSLTSLTIPSSVTDFGLRGCASLTSLTIPSSVTNFEGLHDCASLTSLTIPSSVTSLGGIDNCSSLTSLIISGSVPSVSVGNCPSLTSLTVPEGVTKFSIKNCPGLTSLTIPSSILDFPFGIFQGCTGLTDVYYSGSKAQWKACRGEWAMEEGAKLSPTMHFNSTGPATQPSAPSTPAAPAAPTGLTVNPNSSTVLVNGKNVAFDAYTIEGSNYFKLRDLAYVLNGTEKQFEVGWDNASKTITLTSGQSYTAAGGEMSAKGTGAQSASVSASKLLIDGKEVALTAYTINGNNYFKLRDIGQAFDFGIGWDNATKTITIDTSAGYTA